MSKFWKKIKCATREFFNILTNLICPVLAAVCLVMELFQLPTKAIEFVKKLEHWCWNASGTQDVIKNFVDQVDVAIEKTEENSEIM